MGQLALPPTGTVYVDTGVLIRRVEAIEPFLTATLPLWQALDAGTQTVATSALTLLEVLVKPLRDGNLALATVYRNVLLTTAGLTCWPIDVAVLESAAQIRAVHNLKAPDAIHAATALAAGCSLLVTNDAVFRRIPGLNVAVLSDIVAAP